MALIKCLECEKDVSDKALTCPHCGAPIEVQKTNNENQLKFPELPKNLHIGKTIYDLKDSGAMPGFKGRVIKNEHTIINNNIMDENLKFVLHTHGIELAFGMTDESFNIHNAQIIELIHTSKTELAKDNKSVIGRSIVGAVLLGPLGAIIGGMSGIGYKEKLADEHYLIINYWNIHTKETETLIILSEESHINDFLKFRKLQLRENKLTGNTAKEDTFGIRGWIGVISFIILVTLLIKNH